MVPLLPPQSEANQGKPTLILDIDNTLVCRVGRYEGYDMVVDFGPDATYYLKKRPGVDHFLRQMWPCYEIVYFTSSTQRYGRVVKQNLERHALQPDVMKPYQYAASILLSQEDCTERPAGDMIERVKDLRWLGRDMQRVIWMDDDGEYYPYNRQHGITVPAFTSSASSTDDRFLLSVTPFLTRLSTMDDFSPEIARYNAAITPDGSSSYLTSDVFSHEALPPETTSLQQKVEDVEDKANKKRERETDNNSEKAVDEANVKENKLDQANNQANEKSEKQIDEANGKKKQLDQANKERQNDC